MVHMKLALGYQLSAFGHQSGLIEFKIVTTESGACMHCLAISFEATVRVEISRVENFVQ